MRLLLFFTLACMLAPFSSAQEQDTTSAERYFPLAIGNTWEYLHWYEYKGNPNPGLIGYLRWTVEDTTEESGEHYFVVREDLYDSERQPLPGSPEMLLVRFDTISVHLIARDSLGEERSWPFGFPCPLNAPFDASIMCGGVLASTFGGYEESAYIGEDSTIANMKIFGYATSDVNDVFLHFAANIGLVMYRWYKGTSYYREWHELAYVRVDGAEYGAPTGVAVEPPIPVESAGLTLSVWPNPSWTSAEMRFMLPEPATVRLVVYDMLGREVARLMNGPMQAGTHDIRFDGSTLPAGIYLIRLQAGGHVAVARLTQLR